MPRNLSLGVCLFLTFLIGAVSAAPLDVENTEVIELVAQQQSDYSFSYSKNITGIINITNNGNDDLSDIWLAIDLVNNLGGLSLYYDGSSSNVLITTNPTAASDATNGNLITVGADYFVHIPMLRQNEKVSLYYDVDDSNVGVPILVDESYNVSKIPAKSVQNWRAFLNLTLNTSALPSGVDTVYVNVTKYLSNQSANFGSQNWSVLGPVTNNNTNKGTGVLWDGPYTDNTQDALNVTGITLTTTSEYVNISFDVTGKNEFSNRSAVLEPFGFATIFFNFNQTMSGSSIVDVFSSAPARISAIKEGPVVNASGTWWNESVEINNTAQGVAYVIKSVSVWAVNTTAGFPNMNQVISGSYHDLTPAQTLWPGGSGYTPTGWQSSKYTFENSIVPVIWANMSLKLINNQTYGWWVVNSTTLEYNTSYGSSYIVVEKILVIGTYLVKATKHVTPAGANTYDIYIVVENIGAEVTPTYVWAYDMVPENFSVVTKMNVTQASMLALNNGDATFQWTANQSNPMSGYAEGYAWELHALYPNADGDGNYTDTAEISANQSVVIYYQVQGSGDFKLSDAFIVGIDPTFSMNTQTSPKITIVSGSAAANYESLFALATAAVLLGAFRMRLPRRKR